METKAEHIITGALLVVSILMIVNCNCRPSDSESSQNHYKIVFLDVKSDLGYAEDFIEAESYGLAKSAIEKVTLTLDSMENLISNPHDLQVETAKKDSLQKLIEFYRGKVQNLEDRLGNLGNR